MAYMKVFVAHILDGGKPVGDKWAYSMTYVLVSANEVLKSIVACLEEG